MDRRPFAALVAIAALAIALSGCGAAQSIDPVAKAASTTERVPGFRVVGTITVTTAIGQLTMTASGTFDRVDRMGALHATGTIRGHRIGIDEILSPESMFMRLTGVPNRVPGNKPWVRVDLKSVLAAVGISGLPTGTDPAQSLEYLRAVSKATTKKTGEVVRGVSTTHYHALVDLRRYPDLLAPSRRASARRAMAFIEHTTGTHTIPVDVWIDSHHVVRRMQIGMAQCVQGQRQHGTVTFDLFDYGLQQRPSLPAPAQVFDATSLVKAELPGLEAACKSAAG